MKLLITGGLGFIGSNFIINLLKNDNCEIINIDAELSGSNHNNLNEIKNNKKYTFVKGNISNKKFMEKQIERCDIVINFAAESHVDRSINDAYPFIKSNVHGTFTILDIITKQRKKMIQISTDEVFGSIKNGTANEKTKFNPSSPYASTKAAAELLINSYFVTHGSDVIITRCTNNFGPRQFMEKLIPKVIILAQNNLPIPIYGNGNNIRDWLYVENHCDAINAVLKKGKSGESYNISANNEMNNITIVKKILELMNKKFDLIEYVEDRPGHDFRYSMTSKKITKKTGWKPEISFEEGLEKTINWYLDNPHIIKNFSKNTIVDTPWKN